MIFNRACSSSLMKSNATCMALPFTINPLPIMWCLVTTSQILVFSFFEHAKLIILVGVQVVGNMEDEKCFSTLVNMKSKFHSRFINHMSCLCAYLHKGYIFYKISHTWNALSNAKKHVTHIVMMVGNMLCAIVGPIFAKVEMGWLVFLFWQNSMVVFRIK